MSVARSLETLFLFSAAVLLHVVVVEPSVSERFSDDSRTAQFIIQFVEHGLTPNVLRSCITYAIDGLIFIGSHIAILFVRR